MATFRRGVQIFVGSEKLSFQQMLTLYLGIGITVT